MKERPKKINKTEVVMTRLTKEYDEQLNTLCVKNKRNRADMVRVIIERYIDMLGESI